MRSLLHYYQYGTSREEYEAYISLWTIIIIHLTSLYSGARWSNLCGAAFVGFALGIHYFMVFIIKLYKSLMNDDTIILVYMCVCGGGALEGD